MRAAVLLLAACGGPPPGLCEGPDDCDDGLTCNAPDYAGACAPSTTTECDARGSACSTAAVTGICWYVDGVCGVEHRCREACDADDDCVNDGEICRADGICTAASCMDGEFTCPADATCSDPAAGVVDANGCMHATCADSKDCAEDQHCVVGRCFLEYGSCQSTLL